MATTNLATYSAEDYNVPGAGAPGGILSTYKEEIADTQKRAEEVATAAKLQVLGDRQRQAQNAIEVYGTTLGNMYEGDRAAVEFMRKHIEDKFNSGGYENDPGEYARAIAQLDNMSTNFSKFYTDSYGVDGVDGKGTTYKDMEYNQKMNIANPFEADGMMYNQENDPFDQAGNTLTYMDSGGYAPNSLRVNDEGVLVGRELIYNPKDPQNPLTGEEVPLDQLKHRQMGNQAFMPDLVPMDKSIMALTEEHKAGITSYQQRRKPGTNRYYTYDEANELYFTDQVKKPGFAQTLLRGQFDDKEIAAYVDALNKGEDVSGNQIQLALFGGEPIEDDGGAGVSSERQSGLIDEWKDAGDWSKLVPTDPPITMRHNISSTHQIGDDLEEGAIGPVEKIDINYDIEAQQIEAFTIPGGGDSDIDYDINGISTDHNGNIYASVVSPVEYIEKSDGTRVLYESEDQLAKIRSQDDDAEVVTQDRNKFVLVSGDDVTDPRAQEIYDNLVRKGYESSFGDMEERSKKSYDAAKANELDKYEKSKEKSTVLSGVTLDEDEDENVDASTSSVSGGGGGNALTKAIDQATTIAANTQGSSAAKSTTIEPAKFDPNIQYSKNNEEFIEQTQDLEGEELTKAMAARYTDEELIKKTGDETYELPDGTTVRRGSVQYLTADSLYNSQATAREDFEKRKELQRQEDEAIELERQGLNPDAGGPSYTTIEEILGEPIKSEDRITAEELAEEETSQYWADLKENIGDQPENFWGTPYANEEELFKGDGINTITDDETLRQAIEQYGNPPEGSIYRTLADQAGLLNDYEGLESGGASQLAMDLVGAGREGGVDDGGIAWYEAYTPELQINVPHTQNSGVTIAGLDFSIGAESKLEIIKPFLSDEDYKALESLAGLTYSTGAEEKLKELQAQGRLTNESMGLTQKQLNQITGKRVEQDLQNLYKHLPKSDFAGLPVEVQRAVAGVFFVGESGVSPTRVATAVKSGKLEDWQKAYDGYMYYYGGLNKKGWPEEFKAWAKNNGKEDVIKFVDSDRGNNQLRDAVIAWKLETERIGKGNQTRVQAAADAIASMFPGPGGIQTSSSYFDRTDDSLAQN